MVQYKMKECILGNILGVTIISLDFTSLGVHLDKSFAATGCDIYTFRAHGPIYHKIGGLHPN
ncbi:hypothetical protein Lal_00040055 [Lupinus albus]|nr:hypothetical protein Lal_00040055 [Lupinus albus]